MASQESRQVDGLKRKHKHQIKKIMSNFQLNFNSPKKVVSITLDEEEGIFQLAYLFKKLLDDAGIPNKVEEKEVEEPEVLQQGNEKLD
jgi:hypothetical protein